MKTYHVLGTFFYFFLLIVDYIKLCFSLLLGILCGHFFELWRPVFLYMFQYHYSWKCSLPTSVLWGISAYSSTWLFLPSELIVISVNSTRYGRLSSGSLKDNYIWILETKNVTLYINSKIDFTDANKFK